jgi:hypothetical protein
MLFNVERDQGDSIVFYVVPDAFSAVPAVRLSSGGAVLLVLAANETRHVLVNAGRHETGQCAFEIDETILPGLAGLSDLSIVDVATGMLIYRRTWSGCIQKRVLNLSAGLFPPRLMNAALSEQFQYAATQVERHGHETVNQLFLLHSVPSIYLSGRINYKAYEYSIENGFDLFLFLDEPYMAMAERLIILAKIDKVRNPEMLLGERDAMVLQPAMEFARDLDFSDGKALRRAFRAMPDEVSFALVNPQVRLLTAATPTEMSRDNALPKALDVMASSAAVGLSSAADLFADTVAAFLGIDASLVPTQPRFAGVEDLAVLLREEAKVGHLIEQDLALYGITESAFSKAS